MSRVIDSIYTGKVSAAQSVGRDRLAVSPAVLKRRARFHKTQTDPIMLRLPAAIGRGMVGAPVGQMHLFDSHCHLDDPGVDLDEAIGDFGRSKVQAAVVAGYGPERHEVSRQVHAKNPSIFRAVGLHPWWLAAPVMPVDVAWAAVAAEAAACDVVALGEIGLDRGRRRQVPVDVQREHFARGLKLANDTELPVILHVVGWHGHAQQVLRATPPQHGGVVHRYCGPAEATVAYVDLGLHLSLDTVAFRRDPRALRARAMTIPLAHLVVETDWPQPGRSYAQSLEELVRMVEVLAADRQMSPITLTEVLWNNTVSLYGVAGQFA